MFVLDIYLHIYIYKYYADESILYIYTAVLVAKAKYGVISIFKASQ